MKKYFIAMMLISFFCASTAGASSKDEAKALVEKAITFYKANGKEKTVAMINNPNGQFVNKELYVFIWTPIYTVLAHPKNAALIGKDLKGLKDPDGKAFVFDAVELAKTKGSGWVDYKFTNPETKKVEPKTTYVQKIDDFIFACGAYK